MGATGILLIGDEGTGKTASFRTLPPDQTLILQPNTKDLSWIGWEQGYTIGKNVIRIKTLTEAIQALGQAYQAISPRPKYIIIEDITHLQNERTTSKSFIAQDSGNKAFAKWNQFGSDMGRLIIDIPAALPAGTFVIYVGHVELKEDGTVNVQTAGKLLDNSLKIPSWFTYSLHARILKEGDNIKRVFQTNFDGMYKCKTPMGCFDDLFIPNDMYAVCNRIEAYKKATLPQEFENIK
jgi:hypothetical protein